MYPSSTINLNQNPHYFGVQNSPFIQYEDAVYELTWQQLHDLLFQQQPQQQQQQPPMTSSTIFTTTGTGTATTAIVTDDEDQSMGEVIKFDDAKSSKVSRKRKGEKDRHSKILTANGLRDRRMRLSIPVARKFFALQDVLGFDKASKTIEWLMIQSSSSIQQVMVLKGLHQLQQEQVNSTSEVEAISGIEESVNNEIPQENMSKKVKKMSSFDEGKAVMSRLNRGSRSCCDPLVVKESRKIAREKARQRTVEKRKLTW